MNIWYERTQQRTDIETSSRSGNITIKIEKIAKKAEFPQSFSCNAFGNKFNGCNVFLSRK